MSSYGNVHMLDSHMKEKGEKKEEDESVEKESWKEEDEAEEILEGTQKRRRNRRREGKKENGREIVEQLHFTQENLNLNISRFQNIATVKETEVYWIPSLNFNLYQII